MDDKHDGAKMVSLAVFQNNLDLETTFSAGSTSGRAAFIFKKTEKLVVATNIVAGLIKDNAELSAKISSKTFRLLEVVVETLTVHGSHLSAVHQRSLQTILGLIAEIQTLCDVAHFTKQISEMNASILKKEFAVLHAAVVEEVRSLGGQSLQITKDFFFTPTAENHKGHDKGQSLSFTKSPSVRPASPSTGPGVVSAGRSDRRDTILKTIKEKGEVGVNDLLSTLKGVGGKTIQRELLAMVAEGVLRKQGERRWSRYSIIQSI